MNGSSRCAHIVGSGPNGLSAAIVMAQAGFRANVYEAELQPGGAVRSMELTLPGFLHDFGSAVHPMAIASSFFASLPLAEHGLQWIHGPSPLAHPLDDGTAVLLERDLKDAEAAFGSDGRAWRKLVDPLVHNWQAFTVDTLAPVLSVPRRPLLMACFGWSGFQPAASLASHRFANERTRALFAGLAAHSFLSLDQPLSAAIGIVLGAAAHAVGWPIPRGGSQQLTNALIEYLSTLGGAIQTGRRIASLDEFSPKEPVLCDVTPRQLIAIAGDRLRIHYRKSMQRFRYGPAAFKIDYALSSPIPWRAKECSRAITVHVGGNLQEIARSEFAASHGKIADSPFLLVAQPSLFDPTRAPADKHVAWVYCHVPHACTVDMTERIETQLERFAPGFRDCVLGKRVLSPAHLEAMDANLVGGDIVGGELSLRQFLSRAALKSYYTGTSNLYICSASTPPGGGVHGMCGYHAARMALQQCTS